MVGEEQSNQFNYWLCKEVIVMMDSLLLLLSDRQETKGGKFSSPELVDGELQGDPLL